jgi:hypothetical protein
VRMFHAAWPICSVPYRAARTVGRLGAGMT